MAAESSGSRLTPALGLLLLSVALIYFSIRATPAPAPVGATAADSAFSAERAMRDIRAIAFEPHPMGSAANARVRDYLLMRLRQLGLAPEVQVALGMYTSRAQGDTVGQVHNILARLPGRRSGKALLLAAHYDSVPTAPGAADDGASVAAILETLRAVRASGQLESDVICLFSDGEEPATLGAAAFVDSHPWLRSAGLVLNFDYRGNSGPMYMFETSPGNARLIEGFARAAPQPVGSSLASEVRRLLTNNTDFSSFVHAGLPGLNFASIDSSYVYHSSLDRPALVDERTLQHQGGIMLGLTRYFGATSLDDLHAGDSVYFDIPGGFVRYPVTWSAPLTGVALVLLAFMLSVGFRNDYLRPARVLAAVPLFIVTLAVLALAAQLLWAGVTLLHPAYALFVAPYNAGWYLPAGAGLVTAAFVTLQSAAGAQLRPDEIGAGALLCWMLLLAAATIWLPGASYILLWPLLFILASQILLSAAPALRTSAVARAWLLGAGATPAILLFAPLVHTLYVGLGPRNLAVPIAALVLLLGALAPFLAALTGRALLPTLPLVIGASCLLAGSLSAGFDPAHPRPDELFYVRDGASGRSHWLSGDRRLDGWTRPFFPGATQRASLPELLGTTPGLWWEHSAPSYPIEAPRIELLSDESNGSRHTVRLRVQSQRHAPRIRIAIEGSKVLASHIEGRLFPTVPRDFWVMNAYALPSDSVDVELELEREPVRVRAIDYTYGLAEVGISPRPTGFMAYPFGLSDTVQAVSTLDVVPAGSARMH